MSNNTQNNGNGTNQVSPDIAQEVSNEQNKLFDKVNRKVFKGKLNTWLAVLVSTGVILTFASDMKDSINAFIPSGENEAICKVDEAWMKQQNDITLEILEQNKVSNERENELREKIDSLEKELEEERDQKKQLQEKIDSLEERII